MTELPSIDYINAIVQIATQAKVNRLEVPGVVIVERAFDEPAQPFTKRKEGEGEDEEDLYYSVGA